MKVTKNTKVEELLPYIAAFYPCNEATVWLSAHAEDRICDLWSERGDLTDEDGDSRTWMSWYVWQLAQRRCLAMSTADQVEDAVFEAPNGKEIRAALKIVSLTKVVHATQKLVDYIDKMVADAEKREAA